LNLAQSASEIPETPKDPNMPELSHRHSTREKKAPSIDDLGYTNKEQLKKAGKGATEAYKKCEKILNQLRKHPLASHFLYPATTPGYTEIIKEPMDLTIIEKRLKAGVYTSTNQFAFDVRKIWNNAWTFNKPGSEMYILTTKISENFENLMKEIDETQFSTGGNEEILELRKKVNKFNGVLKKIAEQSPAMSIQKASTPSNRRPPEKPMTPHEKAILGQNIRKLTQEQVLEMLQILRDVIDLSKAKDGLELDLEKLPARKCRELDQFVKKALNGGSKLSKGKKKPKTSESIHQESEPVAPQTVF